MWSDKEADIDYLNFGYLVNLITDIAMDRSLTPSTIGLYGDWGSGKSSLMKLAKKSIEEKSEKKKRKDETPNTLCIEFNGWLFEGYEDTKTSLCGTILDKMADEERFGHEVADYAKELIKKIDYKKILGKGIKYGLDFFLTSGMGTLTDLTLGNIFASMKSSADDVTSEQLEEVLSKFKKEEKTRSDIENFREEFKKLLEKSKVENVVVFIDELDRCNPDTILEVFEAMRLFLFVDGMSFVIGADERLIQYAIKTKYKEVPGNNLDIGKEYLEKVIQYPITIPQLNQAEVTQYLSCLLLEKTLTEEELEQVLKEVYELEPEKELTMELLIEKVSSIAEKCKADMALALQISSVLAPSINGNPRQCKRFLNTLYMRQSLAQSRKVALDKNILAKLMLAEYFNPEFFKAVTRPENRELFKSFERGEELNEDNPFAVWKDKEWVKKWLQNGTTIGDEKLDKYVYFANAKNRYGQSNLDQLSPTARKCFEYLADGTQTNRNKALAMIDSIAPGERAIIATEVFGIIERASDMNVEVLRSYADYSVKANMISEALAKMMEQPVEKYTPAAYAQLLTFISKLSPEEAQQFNDYLSKNESVKNTIERGTQLTDKIKTIIKKK